MLTNKDRYFISNIIYPYQELLKILKTENGVIYFDDKYSPLKYKIEQLCNQILNIFEQVDFASEYGKSKRNELNQNNEIFNRILSYGIKAKHGNITNSNYIDVNIELPISIFYNEEKQTYTYRYTPLLNEKNFINEYKYIIIELIKLYNLNIIFDIAIKDKEYSINNNTISIQLQDIFNYKENGMTESMNIRTLKLIDSKWVLSDLSLNIDIKLFKTYNKSLEKNI